MAAEKWGKAAEAESLMEGTSKHKSKEKKQPRNAHITFADFLGVADKSESEKEKERKKWETRSQQLYTNSFLWGKKKPTPIAADGASQQQMDDVDFGGSKRRDREKINSHLVQPGVLKMAARGMMPFLTGKSLKKVAPRSRSFKPSDLDTAGSCRRPNLEDFFEVPISHRPPPVMARMVSSGQEDVGDYDVADSAIWSKGLGKRTNVAIGNFLTRKRKDGLDETDFAPVAGMKKLGDDFVGVMFDNTDRKIGIGFVGKYLDSDYNDLARRSDIRRQLDELARNQHRPFFTYWVIFVQIVCFIFAVAVYGIAPIGISEARIEDEILKPSLSIEIVHYYEAENLWIGPRQADLIHLGAKYSPCMRRDYNIEQAIRNDREKENKTACCIRNDGSGCVQLPEDHCSRTLSTWLKWGEQNVTGIGGRTSGSVCGQDPKHCKNPISLVPYEWPDDITEWPICKETSPVPKGEAKDDKHMKCEILGRPCCVGIHGQCIITTREFCEFRRGYFHEEATLCSQISCMNEICGMIPFYNPEKPNQFYRLWTSLFLHAGVFQLLISIAFQWFIMRDLEKLAGWHRIAIIYILSGIAGSLGSAIFIPYQVEAGPSGSQFGLLACLFVEVIQSWQINEKPWGALLKLTLILLGLFVLGLLPMIDNWAHLFGFILGFFLAFAFLPYVTFNVDDRRWKRIGVILCLITMSVLFVVLFLLFYVVPIYKCPNCEYFNCIPFTPTFCKSMEVRITRTNEF